MSQQQLNRELLTNTIWSFMGRFGYIIIGLISNIVLVRLLSPEQFGQVSIIMFFIIVSSILIESGLSGALVRKQTITDIDYSTVFLFNMSISLFLMFVLIISADFIALFYNDPSLKVLLQISSLILVVNALRLTQSVKLIRDLRFKAKSLYELIAILIGSVVAIIAAFQGSGALSLIILQLTTSLVITVLFWIYAGPIKNYKFSMEAFRQVYKFGINTTLASLIDKAFDSGYQLILAKYFSLSQAGYFYQAKRLQEVPVSLIQSSVLGVVYATLSKLQEDIKSFNSLYFNIVRIFTVAIALICILIFFYSEVIVQLLYGSTWLVSANYLQLLIIGSFFYLQEIFNRILFKIFDRTELILKLEIVKKVILTITIVYGVYTLSIANLLYGFIVASIISFLLNYHYARKIHKLSYWGELIIISKVIIVSVITILINSYTQSYINITGWLSLLLIPNILLIYILLLQLLRVVNIKQDIHYLKYILKK